jgi:carbonic anhydrase
MKVIDTGKHVIKLYDSVDELPIGAYQRYNKFLLIDAGIGSSVDDFDAHIVKLAKLIGNNEREKAMQELQNMRQNLFMVNSKVSPKYLAFAALVYSIDGKKIEAVSDDDYSELLAKIQEMPHNLLTKTLDWLKKKLQTSSKPTSRDKQ